MLLDSTSTLKESNLSVAISDRRDDEPASEFRTRQVAVVVGAESVAFGADAAVVEKSMFLALLDSLATFSSTASPGRGIAHPFVAEALEAAQSPRPGLDDRWAQVEDAAKRMMAFHDDTLRKLAE